MSGVGLVMPNTKRGGGGSKRAKSQNISHAEFYDQPEGVRTRNITMSSRMYYFIMAGVPLDSNDTVAWMPLLKNVTLQFIACFLFYTAVATSAGYIAQTGGTMHFLNGILYGLVVIMLVVAFKQFRTTRNLPINLSFAYTTAEVPHYRQGPIVFLILGAVQLISALVAWPVVMSLVTVPVSPNWAAGPAGAFTIGGAFLYQLVVSFIVVFGFLHNFTLDIHSYSYKKESTNLLNFTRISIIGGLLTGIAATLGWMTGQFDFGNPFLYVTMVLSTGGSGVPTAGAWAVHFFTPMVGGLLAWGAHIWTWNQNGIPRSVFQEAAVRNLAASKGLLDGPNDKHSRM